MNVVARYDGDEERFVLSHGDEVFVSNVDFHGDFRHFTKERAKEIMKEAYHRGYENACRDCRRAVDNLRKQDGH
jgi:hypothetical protein